MFDNVVSSYEIQNKNLATPTPPFPESKEGIPSPSLSLPQKSITLLTQNTLALENKKTFLEFGLQT